MSIKYSSYQMAIFDWVKEVNKERNHLLIEAGPGSGKTTTIVEATKFIPQHQKTILVSFSKLIADTLATKIPRHCESATLNAYGWRICRDNVKGVRLDKFKDINIYKNHVNEGEWYKTKGLIQRLISLLKNYLVVDNVIENMLDAVRVNGLELPEKMPKFNEIFEAVYEQSVNIKDIMSFDDQKFMPIYYDMPFITYDWVLLDEAQDISPLEVELINRMKGETGHLGMVGDRKQAIYMFKGANCDNMNQLLKRFNAKQLTLPVCYRCPTAVIDEARKIYPDIEHPEVNSNDVGLVETINKVKYEEVIKEGAFVLCRTTAPLIKYCLRMLSLHKRAFVKGREIGEGLIKLIDKVIEDNDSIGLDEFQTKLDLYYGERLQQFNKLNREVEATLLQDQVESLNVLLPSCTHINGLKNLINDIIVDNGVGIAFMTLHKSKGLENPNVFIIRKDLIPHKLAKTQDQLTQENNLLFIGITRSQQNLYYVTKDRDER